MDANRYLESNRTLWDNWARIHATSPNSSYDLAAFKAGQNTLHSIELEQLGDVRGKSLLHLQCHFGLDTLSLARMGAQVTGVDFSSEAIKLARGLSAELGIPGHFICSNIFDLEAAFDEQFDIVFTSHGVLGWLPDLKPWGRLIARFLKPGGRFLIVEAHPFAMVFEAAGDTIEVRYPYFQAPEPLTFETHGSYGDPTADYHFVEHAWNHSMAEIVGPLLAAGLSIDELREFPFVAWQMFSFMEESADGWWRLPQRFPALPLMFSLSATRRPE